MVHIPLNLKAFDDSTFAIVNSSHDISMNIPINEHTKIGYALCMALEQHIYSIDMSRRSILSMSTPRICISDGETYGGVEFYKNADYSIAYDAMNVVIKEYQQFSHQLYSIDIAEVDNGKSIFRNLVTDKLFHLIDVAITNKIKSDKKEKSDIVNIVKSNKRKSRLKEWRFDNFYNFDECHAVGCVYDDSRFVDGTTITTSRVINKDTAKTDGYIETQNTIYYIDNDA